MAVAVAGCREVKERRERTKSARKKEEEKKKMVMVGKCKIGAGMVTVH